MTPMMARDAHTQQATPSKNSLLSYLSSPEGKQLLTSTFSEEPARPKSKSLFAALQHRSSLGAGKEHDSPCGLDDRHVSDGIWNAADLPQSRIGRQISGAGGSTGVWWEDGVSRAPFGDVVDIAGVSCGMGMFASINYWDHKVFFSIYLC